MSVSIWQFILARLDEDEQIAREAGKRSSTWRLNTPLDDQELGDAWWLNPPELAHAERHDPASVLARVESDRRIVELCVRWIEIGTPEAGTTWNDEAAGAAVAESVLRLMAARWSSHPEYRTEWAAA